MRDLHVGRVLVRPGINWRNVKILPVLPVLAFSWKGFDIASTLPRQPPHHALLLPANLKMFPELLFALASIIRNCQGEGRPTVPELGIQAPTQEQLGVCTALGNVSSL